MKKIFFLMTFVAMFAIPSIAQRQGGQERAERLAKGMGLEGETKDKFVVDYKDMQKQLRELNQRPGEQKDDKLTDEEARQKLEQMFDNQQKQLDITRQTYAKMKTYLNGKQLMRVFGRQQWRRQQPMGHPGGQRMGGQGYRHRDGSFDNNDF